MEEGTQRCLSDFKFEEDCILGEGAFGVVKKGIEIQTNKVVAVKVLSKKQLLKNNQIEIVLREKELLLQFRNCPFVVQLLHSFQDADHLCFSFLFILFYYIL